MSKKVIFKILVCALLCAAAVCDTRAQPPAQAPNPAAPGGPGAVGPGGPGGPGGPARGAGFGRGGGRGGFNAGVPAGPPAPVPPQVAIPRPTAAEVAKMNEDLQQFIAKSRDKKLFEEYDPQLAVQMPRDNPCIVPISGAVRGPRHQAFVDIAKTNDFDILFDGDSITDFWRDPAGRQGGAEVFQKYFGDQKVANFAVAGDTTQGVLWGLQDGEGKGHKPKVIMLMIGTNSSGNASGAEIAEGVGADILEMRKDFPDAKILLLAIFPRGTGPTDRSRVVNEAANKIIAKLDDGKHVFFKNINDKFLDKDGKLIGFRNDNLHPTPEGYEIWGSAVASTLKDMLK